MFSRIALLNGSGTQSWSALESFAQNTALNSDDFIRIALNTLGRGISLLKVPGDFQSSLSVHMGDPRYGVTTWQTFLSNKHPETLRNPISVAHVGQPLAVLSAQELGRRRTPLYSAEHSSYNAANYALSLMEFIAGTNILSFSLNRPNERFLYLDVCVSPNELAMARVDLPIVGN